MSAAGTHGPPSRMVLSSNTAASLRATAYSQLSPNCSQRSSSMASEQTFQDQIDKTLAFEGGFVDDPDDPGGRTNFGISQRAYPGVDIASITQEQAVGFYYRDYWLAPHIDSLPDFIAGKVFDMGVNMGSSTAIRLWQDTVNKQNPSATPLTLDGKIGPLTVAASEAVVDQEAALAAYRVELADHYMAIIRRNPSMAKFQRGWLRRANA